VEAGASEHATARRDHLFAADDVELRAGVRARLDLVLEAGVRIHGTVHDPKSPAPIGEVTGARVGVLRPGAPPTRLAAGRAGGAH